MPRKGVVCGEILNTLLVRSWADAKVIGALVIMRTIMAVAARWKLKVDEEEERQSLSLIETIKSKIKGKKEESSK